VRILVTGGAGFIGSEFVRATLRDSPGTRVTVLDKLTYSGNLENLAPVAGHPNLRFVHGDTADPLVADEAAAGQDAIVHFAAETHVDRSIVSATGFVRSNVLGTQTLLEAALRHGVGRFVHVSTDEVYGSISEGSWTEDTPLAPNVPYAASKAGSDLLALAFHRTLGLDVVITRCTNNYGHYQYPEKVIPLFVTNLLEGRRVPLYGDGGNRRDWLHVSDHCRAIRMVLDRGRAGEVYHIGGGSELSNLELTARLLEACGAGWDQVEHVPDRPGHDLRYSLDISKIERELGYAPAVDFDTGLAATVAWYRDNRSWWEPLKHRELAVAAH
jgi:dTDP-glucose 4,6-dehydratase